jgi:heme/copper-type cytochrome/quinol oxidase subunit 2
VTRARRPFARVLLAVFILLAAEAPALACPSCFSQAQGPLVDAARLGMWLLLAVTLGLQGAFVVFFLYLRRRAARAAGQALDEEWSRVQREWDRKGRLV